MSEPQRFPFDTVATERPPSADGPCPVFVPGAYPSALHVRWIPDRLEVDGYGSRLNGGLDGRAVEWLPLAHPAAPKRYQEARQAWMPRGAEAEAILPGWQRRSPSASLCA